MNTLYQVNENGLQKQDFPDEEEYSGAILEGWCETQEMAMLSALTLAISQLRKIDIELVTMKKKTK